MNILVVVPTRNGASWIKDNMTVVAQQTINDFKCVIVDDYSDDNSVSVINEIVAADNRFSLIVNDYRLGPLFARFAVPKSICSSNTLVITIDGDDRLSDIFVFDKIVNAFKLGNLVIYGKMQVVSRGERGVIYGNDYPDKVKIDRSYRDSEWVCGQPRCFASSLLKYIDEEKYLKLEGKWITAATDKALFYCLMELARTRVYFIDEVLYEYYWNPNQHTDSNLQDKYSAVLRQMKPLGIDYVGW